MSEIRYLKKLQADISAKIAELEEIQAPVAPVKWEPKGGAYYIEIDGCVNKAVDSTDDARMFGTERETEEQAEHAAKWMRKFNRLFCWFEENAPGHDIDILFDGGSASIAFIAYEKTIDDLRTKIRDGVVEL